MIRPSRTSSQVLAVSRRIAANLATEALDTTSDITTTDRVALAALALALDEEAARITGVEPIVGRRETLTEGLALIEAAATSPVPTRCSEPRYPPEPHPRE